MRAATRARWPPPDAGAGAGKLIFSLALHLFSALMIDHWRPAAVITGRAVLHAVWSSASSVAATSQRAVAVGK
jgi:hypothetical protein